MNKCDYIDKINEMLSDQDTYCELRKNPMDKVNKEFNKKMKALLKGKEDLIKQFTTKNPSTPYFYGLVKNSQTWKSYQAYY